MAKRKKRISDCLVDSDDGPDDAPPFPGTPRLRIPMFTCARLRFGGRKAGGRRKEAAAAAAIAAEKSEEGASVDSSAILCFVRPAGWKVASSSGASTAEAAAGMGLGLLFLLAKTCSELKKMAEVRAQMEALLDEMRGQLAAARTTKITSTGNNNHAAASSSSPSPGRRPRRHSRRRVDQGRERRGEPSASSAFYAMTGNPLFDDLDRREPCGRGAAASSETASGESETTTAEVESPGATSMAVDLTRQFQHNRDTNQETSEWSSSDDGEFIELDGGFFRGGGGGERRGDYSEECYRAESEEERAGEGVSALEVERRLQEIVHRRSRERIEELESSLRRAERKLVEKEMEARLWKDTAKLALQPPPPPPRQQGEDADGAVASSLR